MYNHNKRKPLQHFAVPSDPPRAAYMRVCVSTVLGGASRLRAAGENSNSLNSLIPSAK